MATKKFTTPMAVCTSCGAYSYQLHNDSCKCGGYLRSAVGIGDWKKCPTCLGTGSNNCAACQGTGWIYVREQFEGEF